MKRIFLVGPVLLNPRATDWAFVAPEAELFDAQRRPVGKHYAGPKWERADGSKVAGTVKA
jgi:hypothetical protein